MGKRSKAWRSPRRRRVHAIVAEALGMADAGQPELAVDQLRDAAAREPKAPELPAALGKIALGQGDLALAREAFEEAIARSPTTAEYHFRLAEVLMELEALPSAIARLRQGLEHEPNRWSARHVLGELLTSLGDPRGAVDALEGAVRVAPDQAVSWNALGVASFELGRLDEAQRALEQAALLEPQSPHPLINLGNLFFERGASGRALELFERAIAASPSLPRARANRARVLSHLERHDEAIAEIDRAMALTPHDASLAVESVVVRLASGDDALALEQARTSRSRHPFHAGLLAMESLALRGLMRNAEADALDGRDRFVHVTTLRPPVGFSSDEFDRSLSELIRTHRTSTFAPKSHATRSGKHTAALDPDEAPALAALRDAVFSELARYVRALREEDEHPFVRGRPRKIGLKLWGVCLEEGGFQVPHLHPDAWLSGVYYPHLPSAMHSDDAAGRFEFGEVDPDISHRGVVEPLAITPRAGTLILFPSHLFHRTHPFSGRGDRISIAFDVMRLY